MNKYLSIKTSYQITIHIKKKILLQKNIRANIDHEKMNTCYHIEKKI
jgi:hypothetical protein